MKSGPAGGKIVNKAVLWAGIAGTVLISLRAVRLAAAVAVLGVKKWRKKQGREE